MDGIQLPSKRFAANYFSILTFNLRDLVPFIQFKKREKHLWRSVIFGLLKVTSSTGVFNVFKTVNGTKLRKT